MNNRLPIIRIESLTDNQGNTLMATVSGCYLNDDDMMIETSFTVSSVVQAVAEVTRMRKQGFEFQLVKQSATI